MRESVPLASEREPRARGGGERRKEEERSGVETREYPGGKGRMEGEKE